MLYSLVYRLKKIHHAVKTLLLEAIPANIYFRFPSRSLKIIAITGTDGKTTTSTMAYHALHSAGKKVALISTVAAFIGEAAIDTGFHVTTPRPWELQKLLRRIADEGYEYVVVEVTSHGIYQYRTWGVRPWIAGLTNITKNEALDYHGTYDNYVRAKVSKLLQSSLPPLINADDGSFAPVSTVFSSSNKDVKIYSWDREKNHQLKKMIAARFPETYNRQNALLVWNLIEPTGTTLKQFERALNTFSGVIGRMQEIPNDRGLHIIVDFAHTPNGLLQAVTSLKQQLPADKRLIAVFGCAGLRDPRKRYDMGRIAAEHANLSVFTAEDPRTEDIWTIFRQMTETLTRYHSKIHTIPDRQLAIDFALNRLAKKGDTIAVFGKGHEQSMAYGTTEYDWSDTIGVQRSLLKAQSTT